MTVPLFLKNPLIILKLICKTGLNFIQFFRYHTVLN